MSQTCAISSTRTLLREYDIRGIVGKTLHAADARAIGRSFGTHGRAAAAARGWRSAMTAGSARPELAAACRRAARRPGSR